MTTHAELSSVATDLDELLGRLTSIAEDLGGAERDRVGPDLYELERMLTAARRRLSRLLDSAP